MVKNGKKILEMIDINAGYNHQLILHHVNLTIYENDFLGIVGANGSGKTTLLKVILGILPPISGKITYSLGDKFKVKRQLGYLPQINQYDPQFPINVLDVVLSGLTAQVGLGRQFSLKHKDRAKQVMYLAGITHLQKRAVGDLSGGERQRVFLARALISSPKLLLLDEPNTFVDKNFEKDFFDILKDLNKEIAIVLVSHDLGMISSHVKTIACISHTLYYHETNEISTQLLDQYSCPIELISHGNLPHRVLKDHQQKND